MVNTKIRLTIFLASEDWRSSIHPPKTRPGADCDCGSDHQLLIAKLKLKLMKEGKTTRPFRYCCGCCSVAKSCPTLQPHGLQHNRPPCPLNISWGLSKFLSTESVMLSTHLILCSPLLLLPSIFSSIRGFSNKSSLFIRWPKC